MANPYAKYQQQGKAAMTPRQTDGAVLVKAARMLMEAKEQPEDQDLLQKALDFNKLIWIIFVSDQSQMPPSELRDNILALGNFVFNSTLQLLAEPNLSLLDTLISINRNLSAGLNT